MFLVDWFYGILAFLGLYPKEEEVKEAKILISGDHIGKIAVRNWLRQKDRIWEVPSIGKIKFKVLESAGVLISPRVWRDYCVNVQIDAVVHVLDVDKLQEIKESKNELLRFVQDNSLANVPFMIFGHNSRVRTVKDSERRFRFWASVMRTAFFNLVDPVQPIQFFWYNSSTVKDLYEGEDRFMVGFENGFKWVSKYIK